MQPSNTLRYCKHGNKSQRFEILSNLPLPNYGRCFVTPEKRPQVCFIVLLLRITKYQFGHHIILYSRYLRIIHARVQVFKQQGSHNSSNVSPILHDPARVIFRSLSALEDNFTFLRRP